MIITGPKLELGNDQVRPVEKRTIGGFSSSDFEAQLQKQRKKVLKNENNRGIAPMTLENTRVENNKITVPPFKPGGGGSSNYKTPGSMSDLLQSIRSNPQATLRKKADLPQIKTAPPEQQTGSEFLIQQLKNFKAAQGGEEDEEGGEDEEDEEGWEDD
jgi:hypothetical protein